MRLFEPSEAIGKRDHKFRSSLWTNEQSLLRFHQGTQVLEWLSPGLPLLHFVTVEDLVLFFTGTVCALKAADEQNGHAHGHQDGQHIRIRRKPVNHAMHKPMPKPNL